MRIGAYLTELLTFEGQLDRKRYGALLAPLSFFFGGLNLLGFLVGVLATWEIGGWIVLTAITGGSLFSIPLSVRRARDIGWITIFPPMLALAAFLSIAAFMSLLLPISLGIWRALERTGVGLFWWGLIFAACIGVWAWCWNSLLDRPSEGGNETEENALQPASEERRPRAPLWLFVIWTSFWGVVLGWNLILGARYYLTGEGSSPPLLAMLFVSVMVGLVVWNWLRRGRLRRPRA